MEIAHKTLPVEFKAAGDKGGFTALVSVFNNVDHVGDRMLPGSFEKTLGKWRESGDPIPVVFNHDWGTPDAHIGIADPNDVHESDQGLVVKGQLDIADNPVAKQVYKLLQRRSLKEFSFGYTVPDGGEQRGKDGVNDISEAELIEVGPTLKGANPATELQAVKSALEAEEKPERQPDDEDAPATDQAVEDEGDEEPEKAKSRSQDPLKEASLAVALEVLSDGASLRKPEEVKSEEPAPEPPSQDAQWRRLIDLSIN